MIVSPPLSVGDCHERLTEPSSEVVDKDVGGGGGIGSGTGLPM